MEIAIPFALILLNGAFATRETPQRHGRYTETMVPGSLTDADGTSSEDERQNAMGELELEAVDMDNKTIDRVLAQRLRPERQSLSTSIRRA